MIKLLNKFLYVVLIVLIAFLILNEYYVVQFSQDLRNVFAFLSLTIILFTSIKEIVTGKNGFSKFFSIVILLCTVIGGVASILTKQIHLLIYICILFSLIHSVIELVYSKA